MATINGSTNNSQWTFKLEATETSYSLANKTSTVRVQVYLGRASSQSHLGGNYNLSVNCAGQNQSQNGNIPYPTYINAGAWYLLKTFTFTVSNTGNPTTISISSSMSSSDFTPSSASASGSLTLTKLHDAPNITAVSMTETNTQMTSLGVANNTIVQYLSNKTATINVSTYDDATITNYSVYHNNVLIGVSTSNTITINFANVGELIDAGTGNVSLMVAVTDSLGGYNTKIFDFSVIKYTRPTIEKTSTTIKRKTGDGTVLTDNKVLLNFVGTCYKGNDVIGNANKPTVQYKIWNTSEPSYSTLTAPNTANVTIKDYEISNILYTSTYNYKIKIYDVFTTTETVINLKNDKVPTGVSVWTEYKDRVDFKKITVENKNVSVNNDYIEVNLSTVATIPAETYTLIPFNQINQNTYLNENSSFSFDKNGKITITTDDIKKIYIKISTLIDDWSSKTLYLTINKNGNVVDRAYVKSQAQIFTSVEISVKKGDVIHSELYCGESIKLSNNIQYSKMIINIT